MQEHISLFSPLGKIFKIISPLSSNTNKSGLLLLNIRFMRVSTIHFPVFHECGMVSVLLTALLSCSMILHSFLCLFYNRLDSIDYDSIDYVFSTAVRFKPPEKDGMSYIFLPSLSRCVNSILWSACE